MIIQLHSTPFHFFHLSLTAIPIINVISYLSFTLHNKPPYSHQYQRSHFSRPYDIQIPPPLVTITKHSIFQTFQLHSTFLPGKQKTSTLKIQINVLWWEVKVYNWREKGQTYFLCGLDAQKRYCHGHYYCHYYFISTIFSLHRKNPFITKHKFYIETPLNTT